MVIKHNKKQQEFLVKAFKRAHLQAFLSFQIFVALYRLHSSAFPISEWKSYENVWEWEIRKESVWSEGTTVGQIKLWILIVRNNETILKLEKEKWLNTQWNQEIRSSRARINIASDIRNSDELEASPKSVYLCDQMNSKNSHNNTEIWLMNTICQSFQLHELNLALEINSSKVLFMLNYNILIWIS